MDNGNGSETSRTKLYAILGSIGALILISLIVWGLFVLGGADQSALERFRDIAIIFIVLLFGIVVVLLAGITAALVFLTFQLKDRVIPLLEEVTGTAKRVRGTAQFMTEEAVKPIITFAGRVAKVRSMSKSVTGRKR
jgi:MFS superfamily sulfate permease-like transporter